MSDAKRRPLFISVRTEPERLEGRDVLQSEPTLGLRFGTEQNPGERFLRFPDQKGEHAVGFA
jgi:hypothetical protein